MPQLVRVAVACATLMASASNAYTLKQRSYRAPDGSVGSACVTAPFEGAIAFVGSDRFDTGVTAIVVPASNYWAFLNRRYPAEWYAAASHDAASGIYTPAVRQFERATEKVPTVMFMAAGDTYGNFERPHLPLDETTLIETYSDVRAAISNCRLRGR